MKSYKAQAPLRKLKTSCSSKSYALLFILISSSLFAASKSPAKITAKKKTVPLLPYYIVQDIESKKYLGEDNADKPVPPASITKLLTCLIAIEKLPLNGTVIIGRRPPRTAPRILGIKGGDKIKVIDLIKACLVHSANDCAVALAEACAGTETKFTPFLNKKAKSLGMTHSHFVTPNGLPAKNQISTAKDLLLLIQAAYKNKTIREILEKKPGTIKTRDGKTYTLSSTNPFKGKDWEMPGKTGYTNKARFCFAGWHKKRFIVIMRCRNKAIRQENLISLCLSTPARLPEDRQKRSNSFIRKMQELLRNKKYYKGKLDGLLGPGTRAGLKKWQGRQKLFADGILGPASIKKLLPLLKKYRGDKN